MFELIDKVMSCGKKMLHLDISGEPVAQARPRFGKGGHVFEPKECTLAKIRIKDMAQVEMISQNFAKAHKDMPIILNVCFYRPIPKAKARWWKLAAKFGLIAPVAKYKDVDNCIKLVSDALNGVVFHDDCQVFEIHAYARYSENPRTEIVIEALYTNIGDIKERVKLEEAKQ